MLVREVSSLFGFGMIGGGILSRVRALKRYLAWAGLDEKQSFTALRVMQWYQYYQAGPRLALALWPLHSTFYIPYGASWDYAAARARLPA